jgi:hypothetical protein
MVIRDELAAAIRNCGKSAYLISHETGVPQSTISRFLQGADMRISQAEKLAAYFGLKLCDDVKPAKAKRKG